MAVATQASPGPRDVKTYLYNWEGLDKNNKTVRGDLRAASETVVTTTLRRQGIRVIKVKRISLSAWLDGKEEAASRAPRGEQSKPQAAPLSGPGPAVPTPPAHKPVPARPVAAASPAGA